MNTKEHSPSALEIVYASLPQAMQEWIATQFNNYYLYQHRRDLDQEVREDLSQQPSRPHQDV